MNKLTSPTKLVSIKFITLLVCAVLSFSFIYIVSAQITIVNAAASTSQPAVGSTLTVTITISNVQNLAGIDTTLIWNPSILSLKNVTLNIGDSHTNGVLHGTNLNYDSSNLKSGDIYIQETKVSGSYHLVAQAIGQSNPGFSGSGTIATLTFNVVSAESAGLSLQTDLADHPAAGQNANNIDHQDTAASVTAVAAGSSTTPSSSSTPTLSPSVPELPAVIVIAILISLATAASILAITRINKHKIRQLKSNISPAKEANLTYSITAFQI